MSWLDTYTAAARRSAKLPPDWYGWLFTKVHGGVMVKGSVCRDSITRGPRKGEPRFRTRDRTTEQDVFVSTRMAQAQRKREEAQQQCISEMIDPPERASLGTRQISDRRAA